MESTIIVELDSDLLKKPKQRKDFLDTQLNILGVFLGILKDNPNITSREFRDITGLSKGYTNQVFSSLVRKGLVDVTRHNGKTGGIFYTRELSSMGEALLQIIDLIEG